MMFPVGLISESVGEGKWTRGRVLKRKFIGHRMTLNNLKNSWPQTGREVFHWILSGDSVIYGLKISKISIINQ
jgi:hypothetical protein